MDYTIKEINTKRLLLRPIKLEDAKDMFEYASDQENIGFIGFKPHETIEETERIITEKFLTKQDKRIPETWSIVLKDTQKMIGTIDFHTLNKRTLEGEVGYILNKTYWNQGIMTEALKAVIKFGFNTFNLKNIRAKSHPLNYSSCKVMTKAGMDYYDSEFDIETNQMKRLVYNIENKKWRPKND